MKGTVATCGSAQAGRPPTRRISREFLGQPDQVAARVFIPSEGDKIHLARGDWEATMT